MDPITLIVTALATGAAAALEETSAAAIKDAYASLKGLLREKLAGSPKASTVLDPTAQPDRAAWEREAKDELQAVGAGDDTSVGRSRATYLGGG